MRLLPDSFGQHLRPRGYLPHLRGRFIARSFGPCPNIWFRLRLPIVPSNCTRYNCAISHQYALNSLVWCHCCFESKLRHSRYPAAFQIISNCGLRTVYESVAKSVISISGKYNVSGPIEGFGKGLRSIWITVPLISVRVIKSHTGGGI